MSKYPDSKLFEKLAAIEHERWADWQSYCNSVIRACLYKVKPDGNYDIKPQFEELEQVLRRWDNLIDTPYSSLSEMKKDLDREQVMRYWGLVSQANRPQPEADLTEDVEK